MTNTATGDINVLWYVCWGCVGTPLEVQHHQCGVLLNLYFFLKNVHFYNHLYLPFLTFPHLLCLFSLFDHHSVNRAYCARL